MQRRKEKTITELRDRIVHLEKQLDAASCSAALPALSDSSALFGEADVAAGVGSNCDEVFFDALSDDEQSTRTPATTALTRCKG